MDSEQRAELFFAFTVADGFRWVSTAFDEFRKMFFGGFEKPDFFTILDDGERDRVDTFWLVLTTFDGFRFWSFFDGERDRLKGLGDEKQILTCLW